MAVDGSGVEMTRLPDLNGLALTCKDSEAVKLYNEALELACSRNGSFMKQLSRAIELDPDFVLAICLKACLQMESYNTTSSEATSEVAFLKGIYDSVTDREKMHIDAVLAFVDKNSPKACELWSKIVDNYPLDLHAAWWIFDVTVRIGEFVKMRDCMATLIREYPKDTPTYPYVLSMYAFSLEETDSRDAAEEMCNESLRLQCKNPWGIHTMSHVIEEERPTEKGVEFLNSCRGDWEHSLLSHHIAWHLTLYYLDLNRMEDLFAEYDKSVLPNISADNVLCLLDSSSLLMRLNVLGIDVGNRWGRVTECFKGRLGNPQLAWIECHFMMSLCHGQLTESTARLGLARELVKSLVEYSQKNTGSDCHIADILGVPLCNGLLAYGEGRYEETLSCMIPLKQDIIKLGGSWAQRQVFLVTIIQTAIEAKDYKTAKAEILDLQVRKPHSKLLQRLLVRVQEMVEGDTPRPQEVKGQ